MPTATFDPLTIGTSIISYARSRFRDVGRLSGTTVTKPLLFDEEYQGFIDRLGEQEGLAQCAEALAATFAQKIQKYSQAGGEAVEWPRRADFYMDLAANIRTYGVSMQSTQLRAGSPPLPTPQTDHRFALEPTC